jgi:hypothetical protein
MLQVLMNCAFKELWNNRKRVMVRTEKGVILRMGA